MENHEFQNFPFNTSPDNRALCDACKMEYLTEKLLEHNDRKLCYSCYLEAVDQEFWKEHGKDFAQALFRDPMLRKLYQLISENEKTKGF